MIQRCKTKLIKTARKNLFSTKSKKKKKRKVFQFMKHHKFFFFLVFYQTVMTKVTVIRHNRLITVTSESLRFIVTAKILNCSVSRRRRKKKGR